jgi:hypothetical protein
MARSLQTPKIELTVSATVRNSLDSGGTASAAQGKQILKLALDSGVNASEANRFWEERDITITSGNTVDIDLQDMAARDIGAGAGLDAVGQDCDIEEIVCLVVHKTGGAGTLEITPASPANPIPWLVAQTVANSGGLKTGGLRMWVETDTDALDVEATSKNVRFGANGGDVTFDLYLMGRHDDEESSSSASSSSSESSSASSLSSSSVSSSSQSSASSSVSTSSSSVSTSSVSSSSQPA